MAGRMWQCTGTNTVLKCHGGPHWSGDEHTFDLLLGRGWVLGTLLRGGPSIATAIATTSVVVGPAAFVGTGFTSRGASVAVVAIGMFCQRLWWCPIGVGVSGSFLHTLLLGVLGLLGMLGVRWPLRPLRPLRPL